MINRNKLFAVIGVLFAYAAFMLVTPKQMLVLGPERSIRVAPAVSPTDAKTMVRVPAVASTDRPRRGHRWQTAADAANAVDPLTPVVKRAVEPTDSKPPQAIATSSEPADRAAAPGLDFGAEAIGKNADALAHAVPSSSPSAPLKAAPTADPWAAVVTVASPESDPKSERVTAVAATDRAASVNSRPKTAWDLDGIGDGHASVAPLLAAHPDHDLILCLAGCGGRPSIVEIRRRPSLVEAAAGEMIPASSGGRSALPQSGDVVCIAGCVGTPGEVVFHNVRLAWISDEGSSAIRTALRAIADRLMAAEGIDADSLPPAWMSAAARRHLAEAAALPIDRFGFGAAGFASWKRRLPAMAAADMRPRP